MQLNEDSKNVWTRNGKWGKKTIYVSRDIDAFLKIILINIIQSIEQRLINIKQYRKNINYLCLSKDFDARQASVHRNPTRESHFNDLPKSQRKIDFLADSIANIVRYCVYSDGHVILSNLLHRKEIPG